MPGTAAEILDDEVRAILCPDKVDTERWLEVHRVAHSVGLRSNVTIMFGAVEQPLHWARHLVRTRALQEETGGFTEFVPLPVRPYGEPRSTSRKRRRRGPTFREALLMHAVGRIAYNGWIDNIQASWVKIGLEGARQLLVVGLQRHGWDPYGREHLPRGGRHATASRWTRRTSADLAESLGRRLEQRTTLYGRVVPVGRLA